MDIVFQFWWRFSISCWFSIVGTVFNSIGPLGGDWTRLPFLWYFQCMANLQLEFSF